MTRAMKENTPFRIAFCVLCHKYTPVLAELVHQLDAPGNGLFIHVDGKADIGAFAALGKTGRVCFVEPRTKVYWGGFGMVESTLRLFSATRDGGFRYVVLISGDTLPLYPAETIRTVLREAYDRGRQFISANPSITPEEADRIRRRRFCPDKSTFARRLLRIAMKCTILFSTGSRRWRKAASGLQLRIVCAISSSITSLHTPTLSLHFGTAMQPMNYFSIRCSATPRLPGTTRIIRLSMPTGRTPGHTRKHCPQATCPNCPCSSRGGGENSPLFARKFDDGLDIARYREILFGQGTKAAR